MLPAQDLVTLARSNDDHTNEPPTQESMYNVLSRRHQLGLPYTRIGTSTLVAVNPNQALNIYTEANGQLYIDLASGQSPTAGAGGPTPGVTSLEPHVFELASTMYYHMRRTDQDQGVVLR